MNPKKGLFHGNFSTPNLGFLETTYGISTILSETIRPYYVWTDVGTIVELEQTILSDDLIEKFNTQGLTVYLYEIMSNNFLELDSIQYFANVNRLKNITVNVCEYNISELQKNYPKLKLQTFDIFLRSITYSSSFFDIKNKIKKHFWSGNWRYAVHRHLTVAYLIKQYPGNYSWHYSCDYNVIKQNRWLDFDQIENDIANKLKEGIEFLNNNMISIDLDIPKIKVTDCNSFYIPGESDKSIQLIKSYEECFCAVITETIYDSNLGYISEKTMRAISARLPFILVAGPDSLFYLKKLGFKTFDRWWDESYDQEYNSAKRLLKIFNLIDKIGNTNLNELQQMYDEMTDIFNHNIEILKNLSSDRTIFK